MADTGTQLNQSRSRAPLSFQAPAVGKIPPARSRYVPKPNRPHSTRQGERLSPQFQVLYDSLIAETTTLSDTPGASDPNYIIVFEVVGTIQDFKRAVEKIDGIGFIMDFLGDDLEPDEDFYYVVQALLKHL